VILKGPSSRKLLFLWCGNVIGDHEKPGTKVSHCASWLVSWNKRKKDNNCTTPRCSKKQNVKVKMQKKHLSLKNSKFSALNCVTKTFLKLRPAEGSYFIRNQCNYRKQNIINSAFLNRTIISRFCVQFYKTLTNIKNKLFRLYI